MRTWLLVLYEKHDIGFELLDATFEDDCCKFFIFVVIFNISDSFNINFHFMC